jgi:hypothetical protein
LEDCQTAFRQFNSFSLISVFPGVISSVIAPSKGCYSTKQFSPSSGRNEYLNISTECDFHLNYFTTGPRKNFLGARMKLAVNLFEPGLVDVGVNLSGREAGMAEHFLDRAQVSSVAEEVRGKRMTQEMRPDFLL